MKARETFLWGCIGGLAPEVLRRFKVVSSGAPLPSLNWILYSMFLCVYVLLAGAVTIAFNPDSQWKGLWVGASLPAIVAVLTQASPTMPK
jgi:hypothetical protein